MRGHALAPEERLHGAGAEARPDRVADQRVRHAVIVPIDIDVIVEGDEALLPLGEDIGCGRQRSHRRPVEGLEDAAPRARQALERAIVELTEQRSDSGVELIETEEALLAQPRQHPAIDQ